MDALSLAALALFVAIVTIGLLLHMRGQRTDLDYLLL